MRKLIIELLGFAATHDFHLYCAYILDLLIKPDSVFGGIDRRSVYALDHITRAQPQFFIQAPRLYLLYLKPAAFGRYHGCLT